MSWSSVIIAGILTYLTRTTMITLVDRRVLSTKLIQVLGYVPAAVFPAIIFPAGKIIAGNTAAGTYPRTCINFVLRTRLSTNVIIVVLVR